MASRWRVWDIEFKDNIQNLSQKVYQEPIKIEQSETCPCHFLHDSLIELVVSEANKRTVLSCENERNDSCREYDTDVKLQVLVVVVVV